MGEWISRKQIDEFVKYRNTITHGSFMPLDNSLAETAFVLIELVYCCILKRIGMADNVIKELFNGILHRKYFLSSIHPRHRPAVCGHQEHYKARKA